MSENLNDLLDNIPDDSDGPDHNDTPNVLEVIDELEDGVELDIDGSGEGMPLEEARALIERLLEARDRLPQTPTRRGQWSVAGGMYSLVGDTIASLPPGYYDLASNQGQLFFVPMMGRTDKLLRFPHAEVDTVIREIETFWEREARFSEYSLPFKRGILMYGPPGSGKTSAMQLVARDVVARGGIVLVYDPGLFVAAYRQVRRVQPDTPVVVLMEDLDAILARNNESVTLNILDGTERLDRVVFVASTNYPEKLGPRIINRPSRFDKRIFVGHPDNVGRRMYLDYLIGDHAPEVDREQMVKDTNGMSLAHLKELFVSAVLIGTPYNEALAHLTRMNLESPDSANDTDEFRDVQRGQYA